MCLGALCSCAATACAGCCCSAFSDCKAKYGPGSRIPYMFIMFIFSLFAICMVIFGEQVLYENNLLDVSFSVCTVDSCRGNGAVYRTSFTLFLFFAIHSLVVYCVLSFHYLFFMIKLMCLATVLVITFFIPGTFFEDGYVQFARIGSGVFLLIQIYVLIGWAYDTNEKINTKIINYTSEEVNPDKDLDEQGNKTLLCLFRALMIGGTLFMYSVTFIFWGFQFDWFVYWGGAANCSFEQAMLAILVVLVLILSVLPPALNSGSIFTTSIVAFYMSYLTYSALESSPHTDCNAFADPNNQSSITMWLGVLITAAAISYTGFSVSRNQTRMTDGSDAVTTTAQNTNQDEDDLDSSNYDDDTDANGNTNAVGNENSDFIVSEKKSNVTFHVCMAFAAIYMCMLFTGWGDSTHSENTKARGWTSVHVNLICVLITVLLYGWTLIAPKVCPSRFSMTEEEDDQVNMEI
eukprot:82206_1